MPQSLPQNMMQLFGFDMGQGQNDQGGGQDVYQKGRDALYGGSQMGMGSMQDMMSSMAGGYASGGSVEDHALNIVREHLRRGGRPFGHKGFVPQFENDTDAMARGMIAEAGGHGDQAMLNVGFNLRNRADANYRGYGSGIQNQLMAQTPNGGSGQYSSFLRNNPSSNIAGINAMKVPTDSEQYKHALELAGQVQGRIAPDTTQGASHYFNPAGMPHHKAPPWVHDPGMEFIFKDPSGHQFYRSAGFNPQQPNDQPKIGDQQMLASQQAAHNAGIADNVLGQQATPSMASYKPLDPIQQPPMQPAPIPNVPAAAPLPIQPISAPPAPPQSMIDNAVFQPQQPPLAAPQHIAGQGPMNTPLPPMRSDNFHSQANVPQPPMRPEHFRPQVDAPTPPGRPFSAPRAPEEPAGPRMDEMGWKAPEEIRGKVDFMKPFDGPSAPNAMPEPSTALPDAPSMPEASSIPSPADGSFTEAFNFPDIGGGLDDIFSFLQRGGRVGFANGGEAEGSVSYAPEGHEQLPPIDVGRPHEDRPEHRVALPDISVGQARPEWGSAHDVVRHRLDSGEAQLPQMDREAVKNWQEGAKEAAHIAAYGIPYVGQGLMAYDLANAGRTVLSPEFREKIKSGDYLDAGIDLIDVPLAMFGAGGGKAKMAAAGLGAMASAMTPEDAEASALNTARRLTKLGFFSPAAEALGGIKQEKGKFGDFINAIRGKSGVTAEELSRAGNGFTPDQIVTRDEVAQYFHDNLPKIEETTYGGIKINNEPVELNADYHPHSDGDEPPHWLQSYYRVGSDPKESYFISETKPDRLGNQEYYVSSRSGTHLSDHTSLEDATEAANGYISGVDPSKFKEYSLPDGQNYREVVLHQNPQGPGNDPRDFRSVHWPQANVLAHLRLSDRTQDISAETAMDILRRMAEASGVAPDALHTLGSGAPGAAVKAGLITPEEAATISRRKGFRNEFAELPGLEKKGLHIDEIQSDWGQKVREHGFLDPAEKEDVYNRAAALRAEREALLEEKNSLRNNLPPGASLDDIRDRLLGIHGRLNEIGQQFLDDINPKLARVDNAAPRGPHIESTEGWTDLALKRALLEAANGDYDHLVWTPGKAQADRYNLSNKIDGLYHWQEDGKIGLSAYTPSGTAVLDQRYVTPEELPGVVGKELANKILSGAGDAAQGHPEGVRVLTGDDLEIGGHGMREYYDRMVPSRLTKLLKKIDPNARPELFAHDLPSPDGETIKGHRLNLTPEMREAIKKGLPAFREGGEVDGERVEKGGGGSMRGVALRRALSMIGNRPAAYFEVAPGSTWHKPTQEAWETLSDSEKRRLTDEAITRFFPRWQQATGIEGDVKSGLGGYRPPESKIGFTNPNKIFYVNDPARMTDALHGIGEMYAQDAMMGVSHAPFEGGKRSGLVTLQTPPGMDQERVHELYERLLEKGLAEGHSTDLDANTISILAGKGGRDTSRIARDVATVAGPDYNVLASKAFVAFPEHGKHYGQENTYLRRGEGEGDQWVSGLGGQGSPGPSAESPLGNGRPVSGEDERVKAEARDWVRQGVEEAVKPQKAGGGRMSTAVELARKLGKLMPEGSGYTPPAGKPGIVTLPGIGRVEARPIEDIEASKSALMRAQGRTIEQPEFKPVNPAFSAKIADAFERMKHDPSDPLVKRSYDALIADTMAQYRAAKDAGYDFHLLRDGEADPYHLSPALGYADLVNNRRLAVFPTDQGFGTLTQSAADNPLLKSVGRVGDKDDAVANDAFRIVHDVYGHHGPGNPFFRAAGEERAYQAHAPMFSEQALPALTAETRGQNSWVNFGPHGAANQSADGALTVYADQKVGRLPEWTMAPPPAEDVDVDDYVRHLIRRAAGGRTNAAEDTSAHDFVTEQLNSGEPQLPQQDRRFERGMSEMFGMPEAEAGEASAAAKAFRAAMRLGKQTVDNPQRNLFPGIYGNPREIAEEAESRVAPESLALKQLFGVTRQDLYDMGAARAGNAEPELAFSAKPRGSEATENVMTRRNAKRLQNVLYEAGEQPGLRTGMDAWYVMDPLYQRMEQLLGKDEAIRRFDMLNHSLGTMSPGSPVTTEVNRGLAAYHLDTMGRYNDFVKYGGNPAAATSIPRDRNRSFAEEFPDLLGHPYHSTSQAPILQKYLETGDHGMQSPKVPLYIQSSGVPETGFQTKLPVPDAHFTRAVGLSDTRKAHKGAGDSMKMAEFQQLGPWFSSKVANKVGLEAVPAQARLWGAMSGQTGVDTAIGSPKIEMIANEIMRIAHKYGISPERARDMVLQGEIFNRGGAVNDNGTDPLARAKSLASAT